jgi:hypothetical protein
MSELRNSCFICGLQRSFVKVFFNWK